MRIKIIGENDTARAARTLLRQAGFAVSEFLPAEAITAGVCGGPLAGYVIMIEEGDQTGWIHFDSVDCELERAILRHVTQLSPYPVIVDRPGGQVRSDRELRIVLPAGSEQPEAGDAEQAPISSEQASAVEFGVLRGLLDLVHGDAQKQSHAFPEPSVRQPRGLRPGWFSGAWYRRWRSSR